MCRQRITVDRLKNILTNVCRLLIALTLIFSGYVKAIDPLGTQYKIQDYLAAVGLGSLLPDWATLLAAVLLAALEFCLGVFILFNIRRRITSRVVLAFIAIMTLITIWIAIWNPVSDCGCFGDAVKLTNGETLIKNLVLLGCAIVVAKWPLRMVRFISESNQWIVINFTIIYILITSGYSLYKLPQFDFRPYHIGASIRDGMKIPAGAKAPKYETTFIMRKDGKTREFTLQDYPDSTWEFIDAKTVQTEKGYTPPIHDFAIQDNQSGNDITDSVLNDRGYTFLLISPHLESADDTNFGDIDRIYEYAQAEGVPFYCLTASGNEAIRHWIDITGAEYPFCTSDETTLKTIIRSNPGLVLIKDGMVINKWSHNFLPKDDKMQGHITQAAIGKMPRNSVGGKITKVLLWFVLPLLLLTLADRTWAWSKWVRQRQSKLKKDISTFKKEKKMRKKIVAGNWKMNKNLQEGIALAKELTEVVKEPNCGVIICTPFIHLASVAEIVKGTPIELGAENCADKDHGAYTGEVSAEMVKSTGAEYVILGHSERREYYHETPAILKDKVELALANGLKVIFCIGESLAQREANEQNAVVKSELEGSVFHLTPEQWKNITIAYEPIWAIGTGKTATADQAEEIHAYIRSCIAEVYGKEAAEDTTILYGGSCKPSNAPELFAKPDIDGGLIGGASLKAADFKGIIDAWNK